MSRTECSWLPGLSCFCLDEGRGCGVNRDCQYRAGEGYQASPNAAFFEINGGIVEVVVGVHQDHLAVFFSDGPFDFAGDSGDQRVGRDDGLLGDDSPSGDDGAFADAGVVEDNGSDSDQHGIFDDAAVNGGVVGDRDELADDDGVLVAHAVKDSAVLDVAFCADADGVDVSADDGFHPDAGLVTENYVTDYLCGGVHVATSRNHRKNSLVTANHERDFTFQATLALTCEGGIF